MCKDVSPVVERLIAVTASMFNMSNTGATRLDAGHQFLFVPARCA